jgi:hypothetical protein
MDAPCRGKTEIVVGVDHELIGLSLLDNEARPLSWEDGNSAVSFSNIVY